MARITLEQIKEELIKENWTLQSTEYKNLTSELVVKCPEGHTVYSSWARLRSKLECPTCKNNKFKQEVPIAKPKKKGENRVLGLDQATKLTGWAIIDGEDLISHGVYKVPDVEKDETERIHGVKEWLMSMIENWKPDLVGLEAIQYEQNFGVTTFQTLARLQGVLMDLCYELNIPFVIVSSNTWRSHCGVKGKSRADKKKSMQLLVKQWYDASVSDDEADAIGLTKCVADGHKKRTEIVSWE